MSDETFDRTTARTKIAQDSTAIVDMYAALEDEAVNRAADKEMPGGDAMNMLGPVANLEAWEHRYEAAEERGWDARNGDYAGLQLDAEDHPLLVLATWEDVVRDERDQPTFLRATVTHAAKYLRDNLDWMLSLDEYGDMVFLQVDALAAALKRVRSRMEAVLHDGIRSDRGAPCLECGKPLTREWAGNRENPMTEYEDRWICKNDDCERTTPYTHPQYLKAVEDDYLKSSKWLTAPQMLKQWRIPVGTLQGWAGKRDDDGNPLVAKRRDSHSGRMVYNVDQAVALRGGIDGDEHREAERMGA